MNFYQTLDLPNYATIEQVKKSYKKLVKLHHPDNNLNSNSDDKIKQINEAYETLGDVNKKEIYDNKLKYTSNNINYGDYKDSSWSKNQYSSNVSRITPNISHTISDTFNLCDIKNINYTLDYTYLNASDNSKTKDSAILKDISSNLIFTNLTVNNDYTKTLECIYILKGHGNIVYNYRGDILITLYINIPKHIELEQSSNKFDIIHTHIVSLHDLLYNDEIEVESCFNAKYKLKIKKIETLSNIKCTIKYKGILINNTYKDIFNREKSIIGDYIFKINIKYPNISELDWVNKSKLQNILKSIN
jgi:DnaJ-class molecular chaperone